MPDEQGNETMSEKIARLKSEGTTDSTNAGADRTGTNDPAAIEGAKGTLSSTSDPQGVNNGQTDPAAQPIGESGGAAPGSTGEGPAKTISAAKASADLGDQVARVSDGTKDGEVVRGRVTGLVPESNDVMLGDQSARREAGAKGPEEVDGSKSPHDATSDGGSRQAAGLQQLGKLREGADAAKENPAFQAEAKARTI